MLLMLQIGHGRFQPGPRMSLGFQTQRQPARLRVPAGRAGDFVLLGFDHHRLNDGQSVICRRIVRWGFSACKSCPQTVQALGALRSPEQGCPSVGARPWHVRLSPRGAAGVLAWADPLSGRARAAATSMRVGRRPLELPNFGFQSFQALGQLDDQSHQFVARLVAQAVRGRQGHCADYNTRFHAQLRAPLSA